MRDCITDGRLSRRHEGSHSTRVYGCPVSGCPLARRALTTFRVHGVVTEIVNGQARPVAGVVGEDTYYHSAAVSGVDGAYSIEAVSGPRVIHFNKTGYLMHQQSLDLVQDTRVDVVLVRRE